MKFTLNSILNQQFIEFQNILIYDNYKKDIFTKIKEYIEKYHSMTLINNKKEKKFYILMLYEFYLQ